MSTYSIDLEGKEEILGIDVGLQSIVSNNKIKEITADIMSSKFEHFSLVAKSNNLRSFPN